MGVNRSGVNVGYGLSNALQDLAPQPIVSQRDPLTSDRAELGTIWVNPSDETYFIATAVANNQTTWQPSNGGDGNFTTITVTGISNLDGDVTAGSDINVGGDVVVTGDISGDNMTLAGNLTAVGDIAGADLTADSVTINGNSELLGEVVLGSSGLGLISVDPVVSSGASTTPTVNGNVCRITITGLTTASAATQLVTITNDEIQANSGIFVSAYNLNASGNGAVIGVSGSVVNVGAGTITVRLINNGSGALGAGDNCIITLWIIS